MWRSNPCSIDNLKDVDCLFAIDENGTSILENPFQLNKNNNFFTVTGVYFDLINHNEIQQSVSSLKNEFWEDGLFKKQRVVLHSKDIRKKQGAFNPKIIDYDKFIGNLLELLNKLPITIYSCTINKEKHFAKYTFNASPIYELGVEFIIERHCFNLRRNNKTGTVLLESRGKKEDFFILQKMKQLLEFGNNYNQKSLFSPIKGVYFNPKSTSDKLKSYWALEIADVISYYIYNYVKTGDESDGFNVIKEKIYGYPNHLGKGLKIFP